MKRSTVIQAVAALGIASLGLAACSSSGSGDAAASVSAAATEAAAAATEAASEAAAMATEAATEAPTEAATEAAAACANPNLIVGTLLPQTGDLAFLGPPEVAGVQKAINEINANGGVNGADVTLIEGDSGDTSTDIASQTVDSHLAQGVNAIIGAASSGVTLTVIDKITSNGVIQVSPANTSPALTQYEDNGLYWRVAPSDVLQGAVIAQNAIDSGITKAAVIARQDPYGEGLLKGFSNVFSASGGTVTSEILYDPTAASFEAEVTEIKGGAPEAVVVIGFEESVKLLQEMIKQGVGPKDLQVYLVDGNISTEAYKDFPKGTMKGVKATVPTGEADLTAFNESLKEVDPALTDFAYGAQSYDAVMTVALAAQAAGCSDGVAIASKMADVAGNGGEKCTTYADCVALLAAGTDIDFDGVTGPLDFNEYGDPAQATISVNEYVANNKFNETEKITAEVPLP